MKIRSTIHRFLSVSPNIILSKARDKFVQSHRMYRERVCDEENGTYVDMPDWLTGVPYRYFSSPPIGMLEPYKDDILEASDKYLSHKFDLLGSGWVEVRHGMKAAGLEGYSFEEGKTQTDRYNWMRKNIIKPNQKESKYHIDLLPEGYHNIDWQIDFKSGYRWKELDWFRDIRYGNVPGADIKVPWELGRMQHLIILAYAYAFARRGVEGFSAPEVYLDEFKNEMIDFIASNPPRYGVQWVSPMEVSIRAANWLVAYDMFRSSGAVFDLEFEKVVRASVYEHGLHILWNMEWSSGMRANHYFANIAGLLFISAYLPVSDETINWLAFALQELYNEILYQFHSDGGNFEASTSYHRLSAEFAVLSTALAHALSGEKVKSLANYKLIDWTFDRRLKSFRQQPFRIDMKNSTISFPGCFSERLRQIVKFSYLTTKETGNPAQIGDNDSGRFMKFTPDFIRVPIGELRDKIVNLKDVPGLDEDAYYLMEKNANRNIVSMFAGLFPGAKLFDDKDLQPLDYEIAANLADVHSECGPHKELEKDIKGKIATWKKKSGDYNAAFPDFGMYIFKNDMYFMSVRCGDIGQNGKGGHSHNDQTSIDLNVMGLDFIVDPGTYLYTPTPEKRNLYRSTAMHNTLHIDGKEQNLWRATDKDDLFWMATDRAEQNVVKLEAKLFVGEHEGFGEIHTRSINFRSRSIDIFDACNTDENKSLYYHLSPDVEIVDITDNSAVILKNGKTKVKLSADSGAIVIKPYNFSPGYGVLVKSKVIIIENIDVETHCRIETIK